MHRTNEPSAAQTLTTRQRDKLAAALRAKRDEIRRRSAAAAQDVEADPDPTDAASELTSAEEAAGVLNHDARLLHEIDDALARIADGRYGTSEESGEPIGYERLLAVPWARRTAEEEERREARAR
jgi:DnaK suppressor protein